MKRKHFEQFRPHCPVCSTQQGHFPLVLATIEQEETDDVIEGILHCSNPQCQREYPIIDGVPLIVANLRSYISDNLIHIIARNDLSLTTQSLLGDCCGPGSPFDAARQQLSSYCSAHYADLDASDNPDKNTDANAGVASLFQTATGMLEQIPQGPLLDLGCSVGRVSFELAKRSDDLVLGVDLNLPMLLLASRVMRGESVQYPHRRVGLVYEQREIPPMESRSNVDFWACDALALPLAADTFSLAACFNVFDSVTAPIHLLDSLARIVKNDGHVLFATPYDWAPAATPPENWVGGHSQRSSRGGRSEEILLDLLAQKRPIQSGPAASPVDVSFELLNELKHHPWRIRLHDRATLDYSVHLLALRCNKILGDS